MGENLRQNAGRSLLAALPPPKVTLGLEADQLGGGSMLDLSEVVMSRSAAKKAEAPGLFHNEGSIMRGDSAPEIGENCVVPEDVMNHPMFRNDARAGAGGDRPTAQELHDMKEMKFMSIKADDVRDKDWYINSQVAASEPTKGK